MLPDVGALPDEVATAAYLYSPATTLLEPV